MGLQVQAITRRRPSTCGPLVRLADGSILAIDGDATRDSAR